MVNTKMVILYNKIVQKEFSSVLGDIQDIHRFARRSI